MAPKKQTKEVDVADFKSVEAQLKTATVTEGKKSPLTGVNFQFKLATGSDQGRVPMVLIRNAPISLIGSKGEHSRGLKVFNTGMMDKKPFSKLAIKVNRREQPDLYNMCKGLLEKAFKFKDPVKQSMWYQNAFPDLLDGTHVYNATKGIVDPDVFLGMDAPLLDMTGERFNYPASTYAPFLYGDDEEADWHATLSVFNGFEETDEKPAAISSLFCFTEAGKACQQQMDQGMCIYKREGVKLNEYKLLTNMTESPFYKKSWWKVSTWVTIRSVRLATGKDSAGKPVIFPVFNISTQGSIRMDRTEPEEYKGINYEQRQSIMDSILFDNVKGPSKKRKKSSSTAPSFNHPKLKRENPPGDDDEVLDPDLNGEDGAP